MKSAYSFSLTTEGTVGELSPKIKGTLSQFLRFLGWISNLGQTLSVHCCTIAHG